MCQSARMARSSDGVDVVRRQQVHDAAIAEFSRRGFAATSMADIAAAAGVSRPALYQYFRNKADVFASAFSALLEDAVDRSLAALGRPDDPTTIVDRLDGFLQRFEGDLFERLRSSPFAQELLDAKYEHAADASARALARRHRALVAHLRALDADRARRDAWVDLLELGPSGLKQDAPTVARHRRRLRALATSVAADIERSSTRLAVCTSPTTT